MTLLSLLAIALILLLALYALGLYAATCTFLFTRRARIGAEVAPPATERASIDAPIAVLVPARNEGAMALRVIQSLLDQDTPAPVAIHLLLADRSDDSWPYLQAAFEVAQSMAAVQLLLHFHSPHARVFMMKRKGSGGQQVRTDARKHLLFFLDFGFPTGRSINRLPFPPAQPTLFHA